MTALSYKKGRKLPKGITIRKDGRYMARFQYEGESYTLYGNKLESLLEQIEDLKYEVRHGLYEKEQNIIIDAWFHTWMEEYKKNQVKPTTYDLYERTYEGHIKQYIQKRKLKDIRPEHIQRIFNAEAKRVKRKTLTRIHVILNGLFQQAYKNGIIQKNPVKRDIPMLDNVYQILKQKRKKWLQLKIALGDKWTPLDGLDNLAFTNEFGSVVTLNTMQYYMKHIQELIQRDDIKFEPIHIHTLHHTFATRCIENGMQPQVLKTILGHSSLTMTMDLYNHVLPNVKVDEIQKIANLF